MAPSLTGLPPETLLAIAGYLDNPTDYVHLSRSHRSISRTLHDREVLAKTIGVSIRHRAIQTISDLEAHSVLLSIAKNAVCLRRGKSSPSTL